MVADLQYLVSSTKFADFGEFEKFRIWIRDIRKFCISIRYWTSELSVLDSWFVALVL